jgi:hypothetical protein
MPSNIRTGLMAAVLLAALGGGAFAASFTTLHSFAGSDGA